MDYFYGVNLITLVVTNLRERLVSCVTSQRAIWFNKLVKKWSIQTKERMSIKENTGQICSSILELLSQQSQGLVGSANCLSIMNTSFMEPPLRLVVQPPTNDCKLKRRYCCGESSLTQKKPSGKHAITIMCQL